MRMVLSLEILIERLYVKDLEGASSVPRHSRILLIAAGTLVGMFLIQAAIPPEGSNDQ